MELMTTTTSKHYPGPCKLVVDALPRNIAGLAVGKVSWSLPRRQYCNVALLRWQEFATRSVAVFFFKYDRGGSAGVGGKYRSESRLGLLIGNRWMPGLVVLECANCSV